MAALITKIAVQGERTPTSLTFPARTRMVLLRETARQFEYCANRIVTCVLIVIAGLSGPASAKPAQGQSVPSNQAGSARLQGVVLDSRGRPIADATLYLREKIGTQTLTARTDSEGTYRFSSLGKGVFTLQARMAGYGDVTFGPVVLEPREAKRIDLTLVSATVSAVQSSLPRSSGAEQPQFFDEPEFTVAGVTEAMNPGGHGSNTILRTTEVLAKETASLTVTAVNHGPASDSLSPDTKESLRKAIEREPGSFDANHRLGKFLVDDGKAGEAIPYLERASQLNPVEYQTAYELARAYADADQYERARAQARTLLARQNKSAQEQAELHHLLGDVEEKSGNPLDAVQEYQQATELNPTEPNLFDWGTDLLMHRAYEPAIEVFTKGNHLFPSSTRMLSGLGVSEYARGAYEEAAQRLCEASDLSPNDPQPYLFLGKMQSVRTTQSDCQ